MRVREVAKRGADAYVERLQNSIEYARGVESRFYKSIEEASDTGVGVVATTDMDMLGQWGINPRTAHKEIAAGHNRPFLFATRLTHSGYMGRIYFRSKTIELTVPKTKRMETVVGGLLLVAKKQDVGRWGNEFGNETVILDDSPRLWNFYFLGDQGEKLFEGFLEQCRTDPVFRIILNLGPRK